MNIVIKDNFEPIKFLTFVDLRGGDIFRKVGEFSLYMKIEEQNTGNNAIDLQNGLTYIISEDTPVEKYIGQAIFNNKAFTREGQ